MKKGALILPLIFLYLFTASAQEIKYEKSLEEAKKISGEQGKPLAILITIQPPRGVTTVLQGLSDKEVVDKFNNSFINFKIDRSDTTTRAIIKEYHVTGFPAFVFVDSKGGLMYKDFGSLSPQRYLIMADRAIDASKQKSLSDFENEYKAGAYDQQFLKDYINKRMQAGIADNSAIIEKYVDFLKVSDLNNYNQVLFILRAGPLIDSKAYKLAYTNRKVTDSIFKTALPEVRSALNNAIIVNTMADAIATKNITRATAVATYTRNTWSGKDPREGQKNFSLKMLQYFSAIKDTTSYLRQAGTFYDQYYMNISADSLRRLDEKSMEKARNDAKERAVMNIPEGGALQSFSFAYAASNYGTQLNNGAWSVYLTGTKNAAFITKAMLWSKRSIELSPKISAYHDTLAHLLYRLEFYVEAESTQKKAIELGKEEKGNVDAMQSELEKIQKRTL